MSNHMNEEVLTSQEVAKLLKASNQTIWRWFKSGKLPAFKVGSKWLIRRDDLDRAVNRKIKVNSIKYEGSNSTIC